MWTPMWTPRGYTPLNLGSPSLSPSPRSRRPRVIAVVAVIAGATSLASLWHLSDGGGNLSSLLARPPPEACNPYAQPGMLMHDPVDPHANRWHPFAGMREAETESVNASDTRMVKSETDACYQPAPALAAAFVRASWDAMPHSANTTLDGEWAKADQGPDGRPWEDVEFARNRTILYIGDSISRFTTKYFCEMAGENVIELTWGHPWSPPEILKDGSVKDDDEEIAYDNLDPFGWHKMEPGNQGSHIAHYCYVPGMDFLLVHLHTYGLDEDDFWVTKPSYIPPYSFEDRVRRLAGPYINRIRATTGRGSKAPELVYVNSGMWDVMHFAHKDLAAEVSLSTSLGPGRLAWYRRRVRDALTVTAKQFPDASVYWSSTHYPIKPSNGWFFANIKPKHRPDTKLLRLAEMHAAAVSAFEDTVDATEDDRAILDKVQLGRWGLASVGQEEHQIDDLHPTFLPTGYLWADLALYDLRNEVLRRGL